MKKFTQFLAVVCTAPLAVFGAAMDQPAQTNSGAAAPSLTSSPMSDSPIIATGKGVSVTRAQLDQVLTAIKAEAAAQGQAVPPARASEIQRQLLDGLISRQLLLSKATEADKAKGREQFNAWVHQVKTNANLTDAEFDKKLAPSLLIMGQTKDEWEKQKIEQYTIPVVLERELKINVTEDEAKKYYDENPARFEEPEMVRVGHILLSTRDLNTGAEFSTEKKAEQKKRAEDLLKSARGGEDFAKLARENSDDAGSKDKGGEITFPRGNPRIPPEFEAAAFSLNTNQVSDIVTTPYGYHIIKLYEKIPAKKEPYNGLDTKTVIVKNDGQHATLKELLTDLAMQKQAVEYVKQLRKEADVKILDDSLKPLADAASAPDVETPAAGATNK